MKGRQEQKYFLICLTDSERAKNSIQVWTQTAHLSLLSKKEPWWIYKVKLKDLTGEKIPSSATFVYSVA